MVTIQQYTEITPCTTGHGPSVPNMTNNNNNKKKTTTTTKTETNKQNQSGCSCLFSNTNHIYYYSNIVYDTPICISQIMFIFFVISLYNKALQMYMLIVVYTFDVTGVKSVFVVMISITNKKDDNHLRYLSCFYKNQRPKVRFSFNTCCLFDSCLYTLFLFDDVLWCSTHIVLCFCLCFFVLSTLSFSGLVLNDCPFGIP